MSADGGNNTVNAETSPVQQNNSTPDDSDSGATETACNPTLAESEYSENDLEVLKGDAIGETLYSERFVLKTLLKLGELKVDLQEDEAFERDLCLLWDMTVEEDVVIYLLKQEVVDLFGVLITNTKDVRLTEILVGMLGNMCSVQQTRDVLTEKVEVVAILLALMDSVDSLMLEQLMRLLTVIFMKMPEDHVEKWCTEIMKAESFIENLCFIISGSVIDSLILQALEALNAILAKFFVRKLSLATENEEFVDKNRMAAFEKMFTCPALVASTVEAYNTLVKKDGGNRDKFDASEKSQIINKGKRLFCNVHSIIAQCELAKRSYDLCADDVLLCFKEILESMLEENSITNWQQHDLDVLEALNDILKISTDPLEEPILNCLLKLFYTLDQEQIENTSESNNDFESAEDGDIDHKISYTLILDSLYLLVYKADEDLLKDYISECPRIYVDKLLQTFEGSRKTDIAYSDEYIQCCFSRLKSAIAQ